MGKINIRVCEICRKSECEGKIFETEHMYGSYGFDVGIKRICSSDKNLINKDGKYFYKLVSGHGDSTNYNVKEICNDKRT